MVVEESDAPVSVYSSDGALCRTVHLHLSQHQLCLGLNIRGGREYNLGIYVSKSVQQQTHTYNRTELLVPLVSTLILNNSFDFIAFLNSFGCINTKIRSNINYFTKSIKSKTLMLAWQSLVWIFTIIFKALSKFEVILVSLRYYYIFY